MTVQVDGPEARSPLRALASTPVAAVGLLVGLGLVAEFIPALAHLKVFSVPPPLREEKAAFMGPRGPMKVGEAELTQQSTSAPPAGLRATGPTRGPIGGSQEALDLPEIETEAPPIPLLDPTGHSLDSFFASLAKTQNDESITRIAHFGDSMIVSDYVSATLREKLQETFGDAGHGYMLTANAWPAYFHQGVFRFATKGWRVSRIVGPLTDDEMYGLGGVTFRAYSGVRAQYGTAEDGEIGTRASRFVVSYLARPGGGSFEVLVDGKPHSLVDTEAEHKEARAHVVEVPDGPHRFELVAKAGEIRTFGVILERTEPGVVLDALGVQGARIRFLDKQDDAHYAQQLAWRDPDLIVYQFGANESGDGYAYPMDEYLHTMKAVIEQGQEAVPDSSCLIIGAMDRARTRDGVTSSMKIIQLIIEQQENAARELGCAYFDTYNSMGGWGSMPAWVRRGLGQADMTHPTGVGAMRIGNWIYRALMTRYDAYLREQKARSDPAQVATPAP